MGDTSDVLAATQSNKRASRALFWLFGSIVGSILTVLIVRLTRHEASSTKEWSSGSISPPQPLSPAPLQAEPARSSSTGIPSSSIALVVSLAVAILGTGGWGLALYSESAERLPDAAPNGAITLFTTGGAEISLVQLALNAPSKADEEPSQRAVLALYVDGSTAEPDQEHWAIFVAEPTALANNVKISNARSLCDTNGPDDTVEVHNSIKNVGIARASLLDGRTGLAIVGSMPTGETAYAEGGSYLICLALSLSPGPIDNSPAQYAIHPPEIGNFVGADVDLAQLQLGAPISGEVPDIQQWADAGGDTNISVEVDGQQPDDILSSTRDLADPTDTADWVWRGTGLLRVNAIASRPSVQNEQQRDAFRAGLLLSLSASLLVWMMELVFGPDRRRMFAKT